MLKVKNIYIVLNKVSWYQHDYFYLFTLDTVNCMIK